jgi:hypothetical protein
MGAWIQGGIWRTEPVGRRGSSGPNELISGRAPLPHGQSAAVRRPRPRQNRSPRAGIGVDTTSVYWENRAPQRSRDSFEAGDGRGGRLAFAGRTARFLPALCVAAGLFVAAPIFDARVARADTASCDSYEVEYTLSANFKLDDTFMGAGNGIFPTGPGRVVLRWSHVAPASAVVEMLSYEMHQPFAMSTHALLWSAKLVSDTMARATSDSRGVVTTGALEGRTIRWEHPVNGYHVDGTLDCEGSLCGKFGAPPSGKSDVHVPPHAVGFKPFELSADGKTFTMDYVVVSKADSPKQTTLIAIAGREAKRTCVASKP